MNIKTKPTEPDCIERLRRALSYRDKARMAAKLDEATQFAAQAHEREADRLLQGVRDEISRTAVVLGEQLKLTVARQDRLIIDAGAGFVHPAKANSLNRMYDARINELRERIARCNTAMNAQSADELGGFIDLPLVEYLGIIRKRVPLGNLKPTRAGFIVWIAGVALAVLGSLYYLDYFKVIPPIVLEVSSVEDEQANVRIMCRNDSQKPILLYVPWHPQISTEVAGFRGNEGYGVALYIRTKAGRQYQRFPVPLEAWSYQGRTLKEGATIEIAPHLYVNLELDLKKIPAPDDFTGAKIIVLDEDGTTVVEQEIQPAS